MHSVTCIAITRPIQIQIFADKLHANGQCDFLCASYACMLQIAQKNDYNMWVNFVVCVRRGRAFEAGSINAIVFMLLTAVCMIEPEGRRGCAADIYAGTHSLMANPKFKYSPASILHVYSVLRRRCRCRRSHNNTVIKPNISMLAIYVVV